MSSHNNRRLHILGSVKLLVALFLPSARDVICFILACKTFSGLRHSHREWSLVVSHLCRRWDLNPVDVRSWQGERPTLLEKPGTVDYKWYQYRHAHPFHMWQEPADFAHLPELWGCLVAHAPHHFVSPESRDVRFVHDLELCAALAKRVRFAGTFELFGNHASFSQVPILIPWSREVAVSATEIAFALGVTGAEAAVDWTAQHLRVFRRTFRERAWSPWNGFWSVWGCGDYDPEVDFKAIRVFQQRAKHQLQEQQQCLEVDGSKANTSKRLRKARQKRRRRAAAARGNICSPFNQCQQFPPHLLQQVQQAENNKDKDLKRQEQRRHWAQRQATARFLPPSRSMAAVDTRLKCYAAEHRDPWWYVCDLMGSLQGARTYRLCPDSTDRTWPILRCGQSKTGNLIGLLLASEQAFL